MGTAIMHTQLDRIERKLDALTALVRAVLIGETTMAMDLSELVEQVQAIADAEAAAVVALNELYSQLMQAQGDQSAINAITAKLGAIKDDLAKAIVANTPAAPAPPTAS